MNLKIKTLFLIGSVVISIILSSCKKDENNEPVITTQIPDVTGQTGSFIDDRDDKTYHYIGIGTQFWMMENLAYVDSGIQHITDNSEWEDNIDYDGWCYYEDSVNNGSTYGVLYQWKAAKIACPSGWHLPTYDEWTTLINSLGGDNIAGGKMKEEGTAHWNSPNVDATNTSNFSALPSGRHFYRGSFDGLGNYGYYWCDTEFNSYSAYSILLGFDYANTNVHLDGKKLNGLAVRCVKD